MEEPTVVNIEPRLGKSSETSLLSSITRGKFKTNQIIFIVLIIVMIVVMIVVGSLYFYFGYYRQQKINSVYNVTEAQKPVHNNAKTAVDKHTNIISKVKDSDILSSLSKLKDKITGKSEVVSTKTDSFNVTVKGKVDGNDAKVEEINIDTQDGSRMFDWNKEHEQTQDDITIDIENSSDDKEQTNTEETEEVKPPDDIINMI
jgi:hypothetical protein